MVNRVLFAALLLTATFSFSAERLNIAVTASFRPVLDALVPEFERTSGFDVNLSSASTGVLYQQILSGAPFDIFFAADSERPEKLQAELQLPDERRQTYASGRLVLVSTDSQIRSLADLKTYNRRIIMANPKHAPYGAAAQDILDTLGFEGPRVLASNVSQARQYLELSLASVGLIAASVAEGLPVVQRIESDRHRPLQQQLLVLREHPGISTLLLFMQRPESVRLIQRFGYDLPEPDL